MDSDSEDFDLENINIDNLDLNSPIAKHILKDYKEPEAGYDKVGFSRPLGGFFMEFGYAIIGAVFVLIMFTQLLRILYPYPDSKAYSSVGNILFGFIFFILNIPTAFSLERFIAEWRIKNPNKMIQYIRFYAWYQMITGIILVTITSLYVLYILETGSLLYTKFMLLVFISREYPAMSGVFQATIKGLQRFDYSNKIQFWEQNLIKPATELSCVLFGRYVIGANPVFGEIMGIAIGYAIGTYLDDFITMALSIHYLKKVLKPMGFTIKDTMIPQIDRDVFNESLKFGIKLSPPGFVGSFFGLFTFFWWYDMVPAYATLMVLNETADSFANLIRRGGGIYLKGTISESLNNNKKELTHYYVAMALKFSFMTMMALAVILIAFMPIVTEIMFISGGLEHWLLAIAFITPNMIESSTEQLNSISGDVILGGNHPGWHSFQSVLNTVMQLGWDYLVLFVFMWPQNASIMVLVWLLALRDFPMKVFTLILNYIYIQKRIIKIRYKEIAWQTWIAPLPAVLGVAIVAQFWFKVVYPLLGIWIGGTIIGVYVIAAITIVVGFFCLLYIFFPLYTAFGGWDDYSINIMSEAIKISGPSKILFKPVDKANRLLIKSPLHNTHPIRWKEADKEASDLMKERFVKDVINKILKEKIEGPNSSV